MSNNGGAESYPFAAQKRSLEDGGTAAVRRALNLSRSSEFVFELLLCVFPQINLKVRRWRPTGTTLQPCVRALLLSSRSKCVCIFRAMILSLSHPQLSEPSWLPFPSRGKSALGSERLLPSASSES